MNHARLLISLGRPADAIALLADARARGEWPPAFVATAHLTEALAHAEIGDVEAAWRARALLQADAVLKALPAYHAPTIAIVDGKLAARSGRIADARAIVARALEASGFPANPDPGHPELLEYAARLALEAGDAAEALRLGREAQALADRLFGVDVPNAIAGRARLSVALALGAAGRKEDAAREAAEAVALIAAAAGPDHPWIAEAQAVSAARR